MAPFLDHLVGEESDIPTTTDSSRVKFRDDIAEFDNLADITGTLPAYLDPDDPKEFWMHQLRKRYEGQENTVTNSPLQETSQIKQEAEGTATKTAPQSKEPLTLEEKLEKARSLKEAHALARR